MQNLKGAKEAREAEKKRVEAQQGVLTKEQARKAAFSEFQAF